MLANLGFSRLLPRARRRVLVAVAPCVRDGLREILAECPVEFACTFEEGEAALARSEFTDVVVGYLFSDSHMFEFAQMVRERQPEARVLCVKGGGRGLKPEMRAGLDVAAREIGCEGFYDLTAGELPEAFNGVFTRLLAHFRAAPSSRNRKVRETVGRLREAVQDLRDTVH